MKAVLLDGFGGLEVLKVGEAEKPVPAEGQVLVKVVATSFAAYMLGRAGWRWSYFGCALVLLAIWAAVSSRPASSTRRTEARDPSVSRRGICTPVTDAWRNPESSHGK